MYPARYGLLLAVRQNHLSRDSLRDFDMQSEPLLVQRSGCLTTNFRKNNKSIAPPDIPALQSSERPYGSAPSAYKYQSNTLASSSAVGS